MTGSQVPPDRMPHGGWAPLMLELAVTDLEVSLGFWSEVLGFTVAYRRDEEGFVFLERDGAQVMLCRRNGRYETGPMNSPFGQGVMLQIAVGDLQAVLSAMAEHAWPLYEPPRQAWYRVGDQEGGNYQVLVQDPDGYLLMLAEDIGLRPHLPAPV